MASAVTLKWPEKVQPWQTEIEAIVTGADTFDDALTALGSNLPAAWGDMSLSTIGSLENVPGVAGMWIARPVYKITPDSPKQRNNGRLQAGEFEFAFSSSTQQIRRTVSRESAIYPAPESEEDPPADLMLINCDPKTGTPRGTDVTEYLNAFRWRVAVPFSTASESWRRAVGKLRGTLNQDAFFGYDAKSVRFEDITGSVKGNELYTFDLSFSQKDHSTDVTIGSIEVPFIGGWDVIDIEHGAVEQMLNGKKELRTEVVRVKIHRVDPVADWSLITSILGMDSEE